jgi:hypothetical protein
MGYENRRVGGGGCPKLLWIKELGGGGNSRKSLGGRGLGGSGPTRFQTAVNFLL